MSDPGGQSGFEPDITLLICRNCLAGDADPADSVRAGSGFMAREVMVPCSCKVEVRQLLKLLETGTDAVLVVGCPDGSCGFLVGSNRAERRVEHVRKILGEIDFGPERVAMVRENGLTTDKLLDMAARRAEEVRPLGPNPMKRRISLEAAG